MARSLKAISALVMVFAIIAVTLKFFGLSHGRSAANGSSEVTNAITVSPEDLTRTAAPMSVQELENYQ